MNEYRDQSTWFELQRRFGTGQWIMVSTHDTIEEAWRAQEDHPGITRVRKVKGLA